MRWRTLPVNSALPRNDDEVLLYEQFNAVKMYVYYNIDSYGGGVQPVARAGVEHVIIYYLLSH